MNRDALKLLAGQKQAKKKKGNKYGNKKVTVSGVTYDSKGEYQRECALKIQEKSGIIKNLKRQVRFSFIHNNVKICDYIADWAYTIVETGTPVIEDWKGFETDMFKLKSKMMKAFYGIDVWANKNVNAHCAIEYPFK